MLVFVRSLSYTPHASFSEESLTLLMLVPVRGGGGFAYMVHDILCGQFLLHTRALLCREFLLDAPCCFIGGGGGGGLSYMVHAILCGEFLLHGPCCFIWGISVTHSALFMWGFLLHYWCLFLCRKFVFHALCYLISGISPTHPMQVYVGSFSNSMECVLSCKEFLLYSLCCFMWEIYLTALSAMY